MRRLACAFALLVACGELKTADRETPAPAPTSSAPSSERDGGEHRPEGGAANDGGSLVPHVLCTDCPIETIVKQAGPYGPILVDGANVYVSEIGKRTFRCAKTGCETPDPLFSDGATRMALADGKLWMPANKALRSCATTGCGGAPTSVVTEPDAILDIASDGVRVVWQYAKADVAVFRSCAATACTADTALTVSDNVTSRMIAAGSGSIVWISVASEVGSCRYDERCAGPWHLGSLALTGLAVNADTAFWISESSELTKCPLAGCGEHPTTLAKVNAARATVADATHVYWRSTSDNAIERCPVDDCTTPETIALGVTTTTNQNLALDDGYVYWATTEGVFRRKK